MKNLEVIREVITMFENDRDYLKNKGHTLMASRYQVAIDVLKKQIPKKMESYYCPDCRHYFEDGEEHNYCPSCGQRLTI